MSQDCRSKVSIQISGFQTTKNSRRKKPPHWMLQVSSFQKYSDFLASLEISRRKRLEKQLLKQ
jgi:predicted N-acyltransferase